VFLAICAEVAHTWNAKGSSRVPICICPDGRALAIPPWPIIVCVLAIIYDTYRNAFDNIPGSQKAAMWIFHKIWDVEMVSEVEHLLD
jgi:hypothetical protein